MDIFTTKYGTLTDIGLHTTYENGSLQDCIFNEPIELSTSYGIMIPQYTTDYRKKRHYAVSFYPEGSLRRISLEQATEVTTSIGTLNAELITFYKSGNIKRIFPLNGQLTAFWEENDEYELANKLPLDLSFGKLNTKTIAISFYEDGKIKDLTFWPKEKIKVQTPLANINVRIGISLYPNGSLKSLEPAYPTKLSTPIGALLAYDKNANGISGDINSLNFTSDGVLCCLTTSGNIITVITSTHQEISYSPKQEVDVDGIELSFHPLLIEFDQGHVIFNHTDRYDINSCSFIISSYEATAISQCEDCESCEKPCYSK